MSEETSISKGWKYKRLGDMFDFVGGGTPSKKQTDFWNGDLPWASVKDVKGECLNKTQDLITEKGLKNSASNIAEKGDVILITRISPGKSIIANIRTAINQDLKIAKPKFKTTSKFIHYFFNAIERECINHSSGTTVLGITLNNLNELLIPDLSMTEQQAIVSKIEELLSDLENGKQQLQIAQQQLKIYRQSLLKWAFEGKLTNKNVKDGELPKGWKMESLGKLIDKPQYGTSKKCDYSNSGIGVLRIPNISSGSINSTDLKFASFDNTEIDNYSIKEGDILTIRSNGSIDLVGKCALIKKKDEKYLFAGYLIKLRPKKDFILPEYLLNVLSSSYLRNQIEVKAKSTSGVNNINSEELKSLIIPICSTKEQQLIVDELESKLTVCDKIEETISQSLQQAESLRQSILKKAFEGKLV